MVSGIALTRAHSPGTPNFRRASPPRYIVAAGIMCLGREAAYQACMTHAFAVVLGTLAELRAIMLKTLPVLYLVLKVVYFALYLHGG